jgi:hypothetical protein
MSGASITASTIPISCLASTTFTTTINGISKLYYISTKKIF